MNDRVAIVTGVSSGIGNATARALVGRGYRVFGTARSAASSAPAGTERVLLDVRDEASIDAGVAEVLARAGRIDLLVNNAGGAVVGAVEETSLEQARDLFDVNFFGAMRMTQAVLPTMRAQRSGRIVFISSLLGLLPAPFSGLYSASKHAVEGLAESLDHETRKLGIRAALFEPGFIRTSFESNGTLAANLVGDYQEARDHAREYFRKSNDGAEDPEVVAEAVVEAATAAKPRLRYPVGKGSALVARLRRYVPAAIFDGVFRKQFDLDFTDAKALPPTGGGRTAKPSTGEPGAKVA
jgi:NAD(P)-dependent dehydrogenase (short-subunit alcohol dehydrogenase family)